MLNAKKENDRQYYRDYMKLLFDQGETDENFKQVLKEYNIALSQKEELIERLKKEIEIIKSLRA